MNHRDGGDGHPPPERDPEKSGGDAAAEQHFTPHQDPVAEQNAIADDDNDPRDNVNPPNRGERPPEDEPNPPDQSSLQPDSQQQQIGRLSMDGFATGTPTSGHNELPFEDVDFLSHAGQESEENKDLQPGTEQDLARAAAAHDDGIDNEGENGDQLLSDGPVGLEDDDLVYRHDLPVPATGSYERGRKIELSDDAVNKSWADLEASLTGSGIQDNPSIEETAGEAADNTGEATDSKDALVQSTENVKAFRDNAIDRLESRQIKSWQSIRDNAGQAIENPDSSGAFESMQRQNANQASRIVTMVANIHDRQQTAKQTDNDPAQFPASNAEINEWSYTSADGGNLKINVSPLSQDELSSTPENATEFKYTGKLSFLGPVAITLDTAQAMRRPDDPSKHFVSLSGITIWLDGRRAKIIDVMSDFYHDDGAHHPSDRTYDGQTAVIDQFLPAGAKVNNDETLLAEVAEEARRRFTIDSAWTQTKLTLMDMQHPLPGAEDGDGPSPALSIFETPGVMESGNGTTAEIARQDAIDYVRKEALLLTQGTTYDAITNSIWHELSGISNPQSYAQTIATLAELAAADGNAAQVNFYIDNLEQKKAADKDSVQDKVMARALYAGSCIGNIEAADRLAEMLDTEAHDMAGADIKLFTSDGNHTIERFPILKAVAESYERPDDALLLLNRYTTGIDRWVVSMDYLAKLQQADRVEYSKVISKARELLAQNPGESAEFTPQEILDNAPAFISAFNRSDVMRTRFYSAVADSAAQVDPSLENLAQILKTAEMAAAESGMDSVPYAQICNKFDELIIGYCTVLNTEFTQDGNLEDNKNLIKMTLDFALVKMANKPEVTSRDIIGAADTTTQLLLSENETSDLTPEDNNDAQSKIMEIRNIALRKAAVAMVNRSSANKGGIDPSMSQHSESMRISQRGSALIDAEAARRIINSMSSGQELALIDCWQVVSTPEQLDILIPNDAELMAYPELSPIYYHGTGFLRSDDAMQIAVAIEDTARNMEAVVGQSSRFGAGNTHIQMYMINKLLDRINTLTPSLLPSTIGRILPMLNLDQEFGKVEYQSRLYNEILTSRHAAPRDYAALRRAISGTKDKPIVQAEAMARLASGKLFPL